MVHQKILSKQSETVGTLAGFENKEVKEQTNFEVLPVVEPVQGSAIIPATPPAVKNENEIMLMAEVAEKFPEGLNSFRNQVEKYFAADSFSGSGEIYNSIVTFREGWSPF